MTKRIKNIIITGIAGATIAGGVALHSLPTSKVPCIEVNNQKICFPYTDENSGENLLIYTDRQDYVNGDYVYFAINNKSMAQTAHIAGFFAKDNQYLSDIEVLIKNIPYSVKIPEYATTTYDCSYTISSSSTDSITTIAKTCQKREIVGYHQETRYRDKWIPLKMVKYNPLKTINLRIKIKSKRGCKAVKELQHYLPKGFTYFRAKVHAPMMMKEKTEFFIEAIGEKGYGHIDPFLSGYTTRRKLTIDHTKIDSDLTDFPVLVKLTSSNFDFSKSNSDGYDIRFTSSDGTTLLKYERERHDSANQKAEYWVKIPSVSSSADTEFYIYYRTADTADGADPTNVWDSNFKAVYHLNGSYNGTTGEIKDSTANGHDGEACSSTQAPTQVEGKIGKAQEFNYNDKDTIHIPDSPDFDPGGAMTIEIYAKHFSNGEANCVAIPIHDTSDYKWHIYSNAVISNNWACQFYVKTSSGGVGTDRSAPPAIVAGNWYYIAGVYDKTLSSARIKYYQNGVLEASADGYNEDILAGDEGLHAGGRYNEGCNTADTACAFDGQLDEIRYSTVARSAAWIKATYNSIEDTLLTYGSEETGGTGSSQPVIIDSF